MPPELLPLPLLLLVLPLLVLPLAPLLLLVLPPPLDDAPEPEPPTFMSIPDELPLPLLNDPSDPPSSPADEANEVHEVVGVGPPLAHPFAAAMASIAINDLELMAT